MPKLKCNVDGKIFTPKDPASPKCPSCGNEVDFSPGVPPRLLVKKDNLIISFHKSCPVGREDLRIFGSNCKYVSQPQFEISKMDEEWRIKGSSSCINSTFINGKKMDSLECTVEEGDSLFIGNIASGVGLELTITFN
jgi:hypothetical protein